MAGISGNTLGIYILLHLFIFTKDKAYQDGHFDKEVHMNVCHTQMHHRKVQELFTEKKPTYTTEQ